MPSTDTSPALTSRKFLALLLAFIGWTALIVLGTFLQLHYIPMTAMVATLGFVQVSYIFGQSYVDRYVQVPAAVASAAPLGTGPSLATTVATSIDLGGVVEAWTGSADVDDEDTPPVLLG